MEAALCRIRQPILGLTATGWKMLVGMGKGKVMELIRSWVSDMAQKQRTEQRLTNRRGHQNTGH